MYKIKQTILEDETEVLKVLYEIKTKKQIEISNTRNKMHKINNDLRADK